MSEIESTDFFTDTSAVDDPYPHLEELRSRGPVTAEPHHGAFMVTGHEESVYVWRHPDIFSSCNSVTGPFPGLPVEPDGDDISDLIQQCRHALPMSDQLITMDPPEHTAERALMTGVFTPTRLRENEHFMWGLADRLIDEFIEQGTLEVMGGYSQPFATLVIADLLGVPESDVEQFRDQLATAVPAAPVGTDPMEAKHDPFAFLYSTFEVYVADRRENPQGDVLTYLAEVTYPDGSTPDVNAVARAASFLFQAGLHTTARLIAMSLKFIGERPDLQQMMRDDPGTIPSFVDETMRMEGPTKTVGRMAKCTSELGGVRIPAGSIVELCPGAANRDPRKFEDPEDFRPDRGNARAHLGFGHGVHVCPGGPLARTEARVSIQRLLARMSDIRISEQHHGPPDQRTYVYQPNYVMRGLKELHVEFDRA